MRVKNKNSDVCTSIRIGDSQTKFWLHLNNGGLIVDATKAYARLYVYGLVPNHKALELGGTVKYYRFGMTRIATFKYRIINIKQHKSMRKAS